MEMGAPGSAAEQSPEEIHRLLAAAAVQEGPVAARYDGTAGSCVRCGGYNQPVSGECAVISTREKPRAGHSRAAMRGSGAAFR